MSIPLLPPKTEPIVDRKDLFATLPWVAFLEEMASGDAGTAWTPTFTGLTEVGTATKTGVYYRISQKLTYYRIIITPGTNTSSVLGMTYCDNFPLTINASGLVVSLSGSTAVLSGSTPSPKRIYTGDWSLITNPITIVGIVEAN